MASETRPPSGGYVESIHADTFAAWQKAAADYQRRLHDILMTLRRERHSNVVVLAVNGTGAAVDRWDVVGIDGPAISPNDNEQNFQNHARLAVVTAEEGTHDGRFAIAQEPIRTGAVGRVLVAGVSVAKVWRHNTAHQYADVNDDGTFLYSRHYGGAQILYLLTEGSVDWGLVRIGHPPELVLHAKAQADWTEPTGSGPGATCKRCDFGGTNERGASFWIELPRVIDADPAIYQNNVLPFHVTASGRCVGTGPYTNGKVGDYRFIDDAANIPEGWREQNGLDSEPNLKGRVLMNRDVAGETNEQTPGGTGGYTWHGDTENTHNEVPAPDDVGNAGGYPNTPGTTGAADGHTHDIDLAWAEPAGTLGAANGGYDTDNRQKFAVAVLCRRYK